LMKPALILFMHITLIFRAYYSLSGLPLIEIISYPVAPT